VSLLHDTLLPGLSAPAPVSLWPPQTTSAAALVAAADCNGDAARMQPGFVYGSGLSGARIR
jgi:hypothetical protein